jgi:plasmid stabilization system protein ParE
VEAVDEYREWIVDFGDSGYVIYYRVSKNETTTLAVRHQKESQACAGGAYRQ